MYNFSGIFYRIWGVCGFLFALGIVLIFLEKPWAKNFCITNCKTGLIAIAFSVCLSLLYLSRIVFPNVSSYTGSFVEEHRNSRVAPPLPVTTEYIFWDGNGKRQVFYLDIFSKEKIFPNDFIPTHEYTVYFDEFTNVIVKVEEAK